MEAEKLRALVLKLVEREPGLVFDLCEEDAPPPPPPPGNLAAVPSWCRCGNCRRMPSDLEDKCCGCQPQNCVSKRDVSLFYFLNPNYNLYGGYLGLPSFLQSINLDPCINE